MLAARKRRKRYVYGAIIAACAISVPLLYAVLWVNDLLASLPF